MRRLAVIAALMMLMITQAQASKACPTRQEAKETFGQRAWLYWSRNAAGQRCWSNRRGAHRAERIRGPRTRIVVKPPIPEPPPQLWIPAAMVPSLPPLAVLLPRMLPSWEWVEASARADEVEPDPVPPYSTFAPGREPDVWPIIEQPPPANAASIIIVMMSGMFAFAFGLLMWRWQSSLLRITR